MNKIFLARVFDCFSQMIFFVPGLMLVGYILAKIPQQQPSTIVMEVAAHR